MQQSTQTQIKLATIKDPTMQTLANIVQKRWPDSRDEVPISVGGYWTFRDDITLHNGLIFKGNRVNIPKQLQKHMLRKIHSSQQGPDTCIRQAKDVLFKRLTV